MSNIVYIGTSLDGYIADENDGIDWLNAIPIPKGEDLGFGKFMDRIDAIVMGRNTFDMVCGFNGEWPYQKHIFVLSNKLKSIPEQYDDKTTLVNGNLTDVIKPINEKGYENLYIDGGITVQNFLKEDLIDELIITQVPILLGGGKPLFGKLVSPLNFNHSSTVVLLKSLVQSHYIRKR